ncbi:hypothetical protein A5676_20285 [Mycobacterium malmoense]|nr:hypothetical protein A5676_20285 [Mycobacterium malmoense]
MILLFTHASYMPTFERITGLGQLLPTAFTLLGGGIRELGMMRKDRRTGMRNLMNRLAYAFGAVAIGVWGFMQHGIISRNGSVPYDVQHTNALQSVALLCMSAIVAAIAVLVATPPKVGGG